MVPLPKLLITKTYSAQPDLLNREVLYLFLVKLDDGVVPLISSGKVKKLEWNSWEVLLSRSSGKPDTFTKTTQFYLNDRYLCGKIEEFSKQFINCDATIPNKPMLDNTQVIAIIHFNLDSYRRTEYVYPNDQVAYEKYLCEDFLKLMND